MVDRGIHLGTGEETPEGLRLEGVGVLLYRVPVVRVRLGPQDRGVDVRRKGDLARRADEFGEDA